MSFGDSVSFRKTNTKKFDQVAENVLRKKKFNCKGKYGELLEAWKNVVGPEIYENTRLISYNHGKLKVGVISPILLHELKSFMQQAISEELKNTVGGEDIVDVFFMASEGPINPL